MSVSDTLTLKLIDALKENELRKAWYQDMIIVCENESNRLKSMMEA